MKEKMTLLLIAVFVFGSLQLTVNADTMLWTSWISSNGTPVTTPMSLVDGKQYRIVATEVFNYDLPHNLAADAMYYTDQYPGSWNWANSLSLPDGHSFLQINSHDVNWGPFSNGDTGHTYTITYEGEGAPITFRIIDWIDGYTNNQCHLVVKIYEIDRYYGATPGFWKQTQHFNSWPNEYNTKDSLRDIFGNYAPNVSLLQALQGGGGRGVDGAKSILARAAVAALLNSESFDYRYSEDEVISKVTLAFTSNSRTEMLSLASDLDHWNNMGIP